MGSSLLADAVEEERRVGQQRRDDLAIARVTDNAPVVLADEDLLAMLRERVDRMSVAEKRRFAEVVLLSLPREQFLALRDDVKRGRTGKQGNNRHPDGGKT